MATNRRLYRSRNDKMVGGVCAGLADYFNIDPTIVRILVALLFFGAGIGFLPYIILWVVVPEEPEFDELIIDEKPKREIL